MAEIFRVDEPLIDRRAKPADGEEVPARGGGAAT